MNQTLRRLVFWLPPLGWAATIFYLSTLAASPKTPQWILLHDKIVHAGIYGTLALLFLVTFRIGHGFALWNSATFAFALAALYGASDELHQYFVPWRSADPFDWLADIVGASCVFFVGKMFMMRSRTHTPDREVMEPAP